MIPMTLQFQYGLEGTKGNLDLVLSRFASGQPLKPKSRFDEILNTPVLPLPVGISNDLIGDPCNQRDEDHPRSHLIPEGKVMGNEGKDKDAH